jgi:hypothetical protein
MISSSLAMACRRAVNSAAVRLHFERRTVVVNRGGACAPERSPREGHKAQALCGRLEGSPLDASRLKVLPRSVRNRYSPRLKGLCLWARTASRPSRPGEYHGCSSIYLPTGSEPGEYEVQVTQGPGQPLLKAQGQARLRDDVAVLEIKLDLEPLRPGLYLFWVRQGSSSWSYYPVLLQARP